MASFRSLSTKDESAVENLLSQATDHHALEQVAAINCAGFTDSVLPTNLETRLRRLKSLPASRPDPVPSSKKLLSHSKSMASHREKNVGDASCYASAFFGDQKAKSVRSRPLVSSVVEDHHTRIFPGTKRKPSGDDFSGSGQTGSVSSRFSLEREVLPDSGRLGSSFTDIGLASSISGQAQEEGSNRKSKSKLSWFDKLKPSRAMGCLRLKTRKSSSKSSDPGGVLSEEEHQRKMKNARKETERIERNTEKLKRKSKAVIKGPFRFLVCF
ncbi:unnamed protein product [Microthlaspi erraticum]|uniref:Uncharacterized protein n=1 Tax=Microthlaspi erraticum TaxID=1685480 RepID=A0A6D2J892_9BRAS|nr:unnamed protein product [Microthlaspi erraticum]